MAIPVGTLEGKRLIKRHCRHGGLWGMLARDVLWGYKRPLNELAISQNAVARGVKTAEIVALRFENLLGPLYRADIFTLEITDTEDLIAFLSNHTAEQITSRKNAIIRNIAQTVRKMHDSGIYHADLHLKNILVGMDNPPRVYIIDLDKSQLRCDATTGSLSLKQRMVNLLRLDRSLVKLQTVLKRPGLKHITRRDRLRFLREYLRARPLKGGDWKNLARRHATRHSGHRLWWKILRAAGINIYDFETR